MEADRKLPLSDVLQDLRSEILNAMDAARYAVGSDSLVFELESIQLELQVAVTRAAEGATKAKFWVLDFEAKGTKTSDIATC